MNTIPLRHRAAWIGVAALLAVAGAAFWGLDGAARAADKADKKPAGPPPPVVVTIAPVQQHAVPIFRSGIGTVTPAQTVTVKARVDGQLDKIGFAEGQDVKAGQLLARIDPRTLQAQLAQVQAQRAKDLALLGNARVDLQRYTDLIAEDASTAQQVATQKALVAQLAATVKTDDALVQAAQVQLSFTAITAPISGRLGARLVDVGNIVHAADANGLVVINQVDPITVLFTLPEEAFQDINRALNASKTSRQPLVVEAYPRTGTDLLGRGKLVLLNNQIDSTSGTVQLKGAFANPTHTLWPGQFVNVRLILGARDQALTVPAAAVQRSPDGTYVYLVDPHNMTAKMQPVHVVQIQEGVAIVDKGLAAGQRVVVDGQYKLKPGSRVVEAAKAGARGGSGAGGSGGAALSSPAPVGAQT